MNTIHKICYRLALRANCLELDGSDCTPPIRYAWEMRQFGSKNKLPGSDQFFTTGKNDSKVGSKHIFRGENNSIL